MYLGGVGVGGWKAHSSPEVSPHHSLLNVSEEVTESHSLQCKIKELHSKMVSLYQLVKSHRELQLQ